jgi:hypothetical protein
MNENGEVRARRAVLSFEAEEDDEREQQSGRYKRQIGEK